MTLTATPIHDADSVPHSRSAIDVNNATLQCLQPGHILPLGEQLLRDGRITREEIDTAVDLQKTKQVRFGEALVELGFLGEMDLLPIISERIGVQAVRLRDGIIDPSAVELLPREHAERLDALPLFRVRKTLTVAMAEPQDLQQIDELERITQLQIRPAFALRGSIQRMISEYYDDSFTDDSEGAESGIAAVTQDRSRLRLEISGTGIDSDDSPIIRLVNYVIVQAVRQGASDIHIEAGPKHSLVRVRIDGVLREVLRPRQDFHPALVSRIKVMAQLDIANTRLPQDGRIQVNVEGREIDLRTSTLPMVLGEKVVMRVLDRNRRSFQLEELGIPTDLLAELKKALLMPHGLLLVTGPTGSGKTTTLYSALESIKSTQNNIVTVEDPVEFRLEGINQVQADPDGSLTFAAALRSILRQDPDVIMVGEIRDAETAEVAIQAALTGHLVLSTLHTNDSAGAITRLMDMGIVPYKITAALVGVVAQRLVRNICRRCRTQFKPPTEMLELVGYDKDDARRKFMRGEGCSDCRGSGYSGRSGLYEVIRVTHGLRKIIGQNPSLEAIRGWHREQGGRFLMEEGIRMAESRQTTLEEVVRVAMFD